MLLFLKYSTCPFAASSNRNISFKPHIPHFMSDGHIFVFSFNFTIRPVEELSRVLADSFLSSMIEEKGKF